MLSNMRRAILVVLFSAIAGASSLAWAAHGRGSGHGHGGHGHGGHGHGGHGSSRGHGHGGHGFHGGHGNVSRGHFGGHSGFKNYWGGGGIGYYSGYRNYGWPYNYYRNYSYRPFAYGFGYPYFYGYGSYPSSYYSYPSSYYGYPSYYYGYPSDYYVTDNDYYYSDATPAHEYVVSRPVSDIARLEVRLPDPQGTIWVQGKEMTSTGTVRQYRSPQLDPTHQYTYTVKAQWRDNGQLFEEELQVQVKANALAVVDFAQPIQAAPDAQGPKLPDLPPPQPRPTVE